MPASPEIPYLRRLWAESIDGARANVVPGVLLWSFGLAVVLVYYFVPSTRDLFEWVIAKKVRYGYLYSGISTAIFGGLIPFCYLWWRGKVPSGKVLSWGLFFVIYWSTRGIEVDALYRLQAWLFGDGADWKTVATKVVFDQFLYCPVWSAPLTAVCYGWKDAGFSWKRFWKGVNRDFFLFDIPKVLLSVWIVWIPAAAIIYSLPLALQIPLFNLVLCFFVLIVSVLSKDESQSRDEPSLYGNEKV
ncbi:hypothetical protein N9B73_01700 [Verrucomicrobiales bacterium]|jgi:hypothetical protein|nr:hypothetical protein [Verrucomicrobiales bacterium]